MKTFLVEQGADTTIVNSGNVTNKSALSFFD